jgi:hypothetical protein
VAIFTVTETDNYTGLSKAVTFTVAESALTLTSEPTLKTGLSYTGSPLDLVTASTDNDVTFTFAISDLKPGTDNANTTSFEAGNLPTATDAGTYKVWYKAAKEGTAGIDWTELGDVTIAQASLTGTYNAPSEKADLVYSGSAQDLVTAGTKSGSAPEGLTIEYSVDGGSYSETVPSETGTAAGGSYTVTYKVYVKKADGSADSNYETIISAPITVTIDAPTYRVVSTEYIPGYRMIYVFTNSEAHFTYKGSAMYDISGLGYKLYTKDDASSLTQLSGYNEDTTLTTVYAILVQGETYYDSSKLKVVANTDPLKDTIKLNNTKDAKDVNTSSTVDQNDAIAVKTAAVTTENTWPVNPANLFRADVDKNGVVNTVYDTKDIIDSYMSTGSNG